MAGKTFEERFIAELTRLCDGADVAVLNNTLRENLGWQDKSFDKTRKALLDRGIIKAATGQGGKTKFSMVPTSKIGAKRTLRVFVSYCHADEDLTKSLVAHLKPLEHMGLVEIWSDRSIKPGDSIDDEIKKKLESADLILLLISIDFINSKYCYEIELTNAMNRHKAEVSRILPIILRACLWKHSPFGGLMALPKDGKAVTSWLVQDEPLAEVADEIRKLVVDQLAKQPV